MSNRATASAAGQVMVPFAEVGNLQGGVGVAFGVID